jgi:hypothetical protein
MVTADPGLLSVKFTQEESHNAFDTWGFNCGPSAIAAVAGLTIDEVRPHMGDFESKHYTNPTLMWSVLKRLSLRWRLRPRTSGGVQWPSFGLARVQWEGPWTTPGVPIPARYRHTHWVGGYQPEGATSPMIFDVNAMSVGGWIAVSTWQNNLVPWLLKQCEPKANGNWHLTHCVEIEPTRRENDR